MTSAFFQQQMARLSGLRFRPADLETHWEGLHELPDDVLSAAVDRAIKTRAEFPTPVELRQDADQVAHLVRRTIEIDPDERATPLSEAKVFPFPQGGQTIRVQAEWSYYCDVCSDSGWESVWCGDPKAPSRKPWHEVRTCERRGAHGAHEWVRQCRCFEGNPALVRKRENAKKYAEKSK